MIRHKQTVKHDPENGQYGDCHRTALACVFDLPVEEVPHFYEDIPADTPIEARGRIAEKREDAWLAGRGCVAVSIAYPGELTMEEVLTTMKFTNRGITHFLGGTSVNNCGHTVICKDGKIIHDPATGSEEHTIIGPMDDGLWWVTFIGRKL